MNYKIKAELNKDQREKLNKFNDFLAHLLFHRGITENDEADYFINPEYDKHKDDFKLLKDIDVATNRIINAIINDEKICVYSDYDADGIPGAVIISDFFEKINYQNFFVYIPHRNKEGFGLNKGAIDKISSLDTKIIITIDCGISDVEQIDYATQLGIDVIITDHHDPNGHKSKAIAVINPKQDDCNHPEKNLCGSGVIFKVVQALLSKIKNDKNASDFLNSKNKKPVDEIIKDGWEKWLLDMVGIATLSDMVPLVGENRVLAKYGLLVMKKTPRKGFQKLLKLARIDQKNINEDDIGFTISPRINAASRMDSPEMAYNMLFTKDELEAEKTVLHLDKINNERKGHVAVMVKEINKILHEQEIEHKDKKIIVYGNPNWQPSLLGLAASSIVEKHKKPTFLWGRGDGDFIKGSCRSDGSLNLVELMNNVSGGIIENFGGHFMAGGFEVSDSGVFSLSAELEKAYIKTQTEKIDHHEIIIDKQIEIDEINWKLFNELEKLSPFGVGNEKPVFLIKQAEIAEISVFGKTKNHIKILLKKKSGSKISAIKFFAEGDEKLLNLSKGQNADFVVNLEKSFFGKYPELRLRIIDII